MGKGGYLGGSTLLRPGSDWFSNSPTKKKAKRKQPKLKRKPKGAQTIQAEPAHSTVAVLASVQTLPASVVEAQREADAARLFADTASREAAKAMSRANAALSVANKKAAIVAQMKASLAQSTVCEAERRPDIKTVTAEGPVPGKRPRTAKSKQAPPGNAAQDTVDVRRR